MKGDDAMTEKYKRSMQVGYVFYDLFGENDLIDDWNGTEECATLAEIVCYLCDANGLKTVDAVEVVTDLMIGNKVIIKDHGYDDYARGFLAGEILGELNEENFEKAMNAEHIWFNDDYEYGYYQEVLNKVKGDNHE